MRNYKTELKWTSTSFTLLSPGSWWRFKTVNQGLHQAIHKAWVVPTWRHPVTAGCLGFRLLVCLLLLLLVLTKLIISTWLWGQMEQSYLVFKVNSQKQEIALKQQPRPHQAGCAEERTQRLSAVTLPSVPPDHSSESQLGEKAATKATGRKRHFKVCFDLDIKPFSCFSFILFISFSI